VIKAAEIGRGFVKCPIPCPKCRPVQGGFLEKEYVDRGEAASAQRVVFDKMRSVVRQRGDFRPSDALEMPSEKGSFVSVSHAAKKFQFNVSAEENLVVDEKVREAGNVPTL